MGVTLIERCHCAASPYMSQDDGPDGRTLRSMQLPVDLLGQRLRDAFDARQILHARRLHAAQTTETRQQLLTPFRADALQLLEPRSLPRLRPFARMPVIAKRCASSRICATSISAALSLPSSSGARPSAKISVSRPTLRPSPFATPTSIPVSRPSSVNTWRAIST